MRQKKQKNKGKGILRKQIKEGSQLEEQYHVEYLRDIQEKQELFGNLSVIKFFLFYLIQKIAKSKNLIQYLIFFGELPAAEQLNQEMKNFDTTINVKIKSLAQQLFEEQHPEVQLIYAEVRQLGKEHKKAYDINLSNFDYILK